MRKAQLTWRTGLALSLCLLLTTCGGRAGDTITGSSGGGTTSVLVLFFSDGPFTAQFQNRTITAEGGFTFNLSPGTYEITGQMRTFVFGVGFSTLTAGGGGAQSGSLRSLAGPDPTVASCQMQYLTFAPPRDFRVQFTVTASPGAACH